MSDYQFNDKVLVIETHDGIVQSVTDDNRAVYENSKGEFIKVRKYGNVFLLYTPDKRIAVVEYIKWRKPRKPHFETTEAVQEALHRFFISVGFTDFLRTFQ